MPAVRPTISLINFGACSNFSTLSCNSLGVSDTFFVDSNTGNTAVDFLSTDELPLASSLVVAASGLSALFSGRGGAATGATSSPFNLRFKLSMSRRICAALSGSFSTVLLPNSFSNLAIFSNDRTASIFSASKRVRTAAARSWSACSCGVSGLGGGGGGGDGSGGAATS